MEQSSFNPTTKKSLLDLSEEEKKEIIEIHKCFFAIADQVKAGILEPGETCCQLRSLIKDIRFSPTSLAPSFSLTAENERNIGDFILAIHNKKYHLSPWFRSHFLSENQSLGENLADEELSSPAKLFFISVSSWGFAGGASLQKIFAQISQQAYGPLSAGEVWRFIKQYDIPPACRQSLNIVMEPVATESGLGIININQTNSGDRYLNLTDAQPEGFWEGYNVFVVKSS